MNKSRVSKGLREIGACWCVSADKYVCTNSQCCGMDAKPAYHVHPDCSYPHQDNIMAFYSLRQVWDYIQATKKALNAATEEEAWEIMQDFLASY